MKVEAGYTLLEILLVIAIASTVIMLGLDQYSVYKRGSDALQLNQNVDQLFDAAAHYYQAQCGPGGVLDPANNPGGTVQINIYNDLISGGYLDTRYPLPSPLVDSAAAGTQKGYLIQFNGTMIPRMENVCANPPSCTTVTQQQQGVIAFWQIQVAVAMQNTSSGAMSNSLGTLGADCLSTSGPSGGVIPCSANPAPGGYIVFERLPSVVKANSNGGSTYWPTMPLLEQFTQSYMSNTADPDGQAYYYCGG